MLYVLKFSYFMGFCSASKLCVWGEIMVSIREWLGNRIIWGFIFFCGECVLRVGLWCLQFKSLFFFRRISFLFCHGQQCPCQWCVIYQLWQGVFSVNVSNYHFATRLSDFVRKKWYSRMKELWEYCHETPKVHLTWVVILKFSKHVLHCCLESGKLLKPFTCWNSTQS